MRWSLRLDPALFSYMVTRRWRNEKMYPFLACRLYRCYIWGEELASSAAEHHQTTSECDKLLKLILTALHFNSFVYRKEGFRMHCEETVNLETADSHQCCDNVGEGGDLTPFPSSLHAVTLNPVLLQSSQVDLTLASATENSSLSSLRYAAIHVMLHLRTWLKFINVHADTQFLWLKPWNIPAVPHKTAWTCWHPLVLFYGQAYPWFPLPLQMLVWSYGGDLTFPFPPLGDHHG